MCEYKSLFRLREATDITISELETPHLYFSTPNAYKDKNDANIWGFIESDDNIYETFNKFLNDEGIKHLANRLRSIGICCFTTDIPIGKAKSKFLNWRKPICIEYDPVLVENAFAKNKNGIVPFHVGAVSYHNEPLIFEKDKESSWHILWEESEFGIMYKSLRSISLADREFDDLIRKMFTRLSNKYSYQKEVRFISRPLSETNSNIEGVKLYIPDEAIRRVLVHKSVDKNSEFMRKLNSIAHLKDKIVYDW